ncbi:hypothetical protein LINPERPRIM_LOCUS19213 [Linum perenne]
MIITF